MSSVSNILLEKEILLESGTNELEILVFQLADYNFGINVAKVREVLPVANIISLPKAHPSIMGVFKLRDTVVPCVSLRTHLGVGQGDEDSEKTLILTDFNNHQTAFTVDTVERIHRLSWEHILAVPNLKALAQTPVTAIARIDNRLIIMLDFEMISDHVTEQFFRTGPVENRLGLPRETLRILMADDSPTVRQAIETTMRSSGYTNLKMFENGGEVWTWLKNRMNETDNLAEVADLLISDVEMPQIDGLHLCKLIKEHPLLNSLPVILYSSIVTPDNRKKGDAVGADVQIAKPELTKIVELADNLIVTTSNKSTGNSSGNVAQKTMDPVVEPAVEKKQPTEGSVKPAPVEHALAAKPEKDIPQTAAPEASSAKDELAEPSAQQAAKPVEEVGDEFQPEVANSAAQSRQNVSLPDPQNPLWCTFRAELGDRVRHMKKLYDQVEAGDGTQQVCADLFRALHTVKSASMVVPVDAATRLTHLIEGLMESTRNDLSNWPLDALQNYLQWLEELSDPRSDPEKVVSKVAQLEQQFS